MSYDVLTTLNVRKSPDELDPVEKSKRTPEFEKQAV
jgi:hypothetical protein